MHLRLYTATRSDKCYFFLIVKNIKIIENTQQFLSQMDCEMTKNCNTMQYGLKMASQKHK